MSLVGHLRRVLAPFGNNSVGIDKSVFGNGVCGQRPVVSVFLRLDREKPLDGFPADELRCALVKIERIALVYKTVFGRNQIFGLVWRGRKFFECGAIFAATYGSASAD